MTPLPQERQFHSEEVNMMETIEASYPEKNHVPIAICGYSYRLPGGIESDDEFWELLSTRGYVQESIGDRYGKGEIPWDGFTDSPGRMASPYEGLIKGGRDLEFDCALFGVSVHDAKRMDPQIKMMLMATWEALECAGMDQAALHNSNTGVFCGHQISSAAAWRALYGAKSSDVPGKSASMIANRISFHFNWMGPSFSVATACSSGITALDAAIKSLDKRECDLAAFGAVNYLGHVSSSIGFNALGIISKTGTSRSFDKNANGYMRSEGAFMYILKRLEDAERDGDNIFGVVRGCALNTAGAEQDSEVLTQGRMIVAPVGHAQEALMAKVAKLADVDPLSVDYIEAHATGTVVGDSVEGNAIASIYGSPNRKTHLRVASTRSNMGHMEAASFTCSLLKVLLMLQKRQFVPVSSHFKEATEKIPFEARRMRVMTCVEPFPDREAPVMIGINSFGFGGANGHCLIQEYRMPDQERWSKLPLHVEDKVYIAPLSAKSEEALVENARSLSESIVQLNGDVDMYTLMGNLSVRMTHHRVRTALTATSLADFKIKLTEFCERADLGKLKSDEITRVQLSRHNDEKANQRGNILMVFPGQGSQWAGCGSKLYETEIVFRRVVDAIDGEWTKLTGNKLSSVAFDEQIGDKLNECIWAQPVTFMLQAAMFEMFKAHGIHPKAVMGHSAGEAAAAYASGAYSLREACFLVYHRARLQNQLSGCGRMLVLMMNTTDCKETLIRHGLSELLDIACFNSPSNTVVCGAEDLIMKLRGKLESEGNPSGTLIAGNIAFHSRHMMIIKDQLFTILQHLECSEPRSCRIPMISSVTGKVIKTFDAEYWWGNVRNPVNFIGAVATAHRFVQPQVMIEISPHITLRSPIRDYFNDLGESVPTYIFTLVRKADTADMFARCIGDCFKAGLPLKFHKLYPRPRPVTHLFPRYAMKRERVIDMDLDDRAFRKEENFSAGPLLGRQFQSDHFSFEAAISKNHFAWMADHVVQGQPLVPAAAYLELMFEVFKGSPIRILDARVLAPLVLNEEPVLLQTEVVACDYAPHRFEFQITSRKYEFGESASKIHCSGVVEKLSKEDIEFTLPETVPRKLSDDEGNYIDCRYKDSNEFYSTMSARIGHSFSYGPHFQTVSRVDFDKEKHRLRLEISLNPELWEKWDKMGYMFHPSMLDGALQSFLVYVMEASDFSGIPQMIDDLVFVAKPTSEKIIVLYEPPEYLRGTFHQKGQLAFALGERSAGHCSLFDAKTGQLLAHLGDYTSYGSNSKKSDLRKIKHFLSWQPKDDCRADVACASAILKLDLSECDVGMVAQIFIKEITCKAHPVSGTPYFLNVGEYIIGEPPNKLAMEHCIKSITNAPVQYSLVSSDANFLTESYQKFGTSNQDAHLRFMNSCEKSNDGFLRKNMFELMIVRINNIGSSDDQEDSVVQDHDWDVVAELVAPGGIIFVEFWKELGSPPEEWKCLWKSTKSSTDGKSSMILASPKEACTRLQLLTEKAEPDTNSMDESHVIITDSIGYAEHWKSEVCKQANTDFDIEKCASWKRVDYFAMLMPIEFSKGDNDLFDGSYQITEFVKEISVHRAGAEELEPCIFFVYTSGAMLNVSSPCETAIWGAIRSISLEIGDSCLIDFRLIDVATKEDLNLVPKLEAMRERELCVHHGRIWTSRLINIRQSMPLASFASDDECCFRLHTDNSGLLADLEFRAEELSPLKPYEVEVMVKAAALNFRDIMVGLGRLPLLSYEASALGRTVGMECAGVVIRCGDKVRDHQIGDKVLAMQGGCIANRICCHEKAAYAMPKNLSFEEGSSIASVYVTAFYALIYLARMKEGQSLLVHSAMGGVGQAAIALAKLRGVKIYGTAGSEEKREALREMGCADTFDSHSTSWYRKLMKATRGRGVDIVLNSLAGEHVNLCLEALKPGGWHCEIGKVDIFADRPLKLAVFRKNIAYRAIDVDRLMTDDPYLIRELISEVMKLIEDGKVPTLPYTVYKYQDYHDALRCMMNGQHRGKLVLIPPGPGEKIDAVDCRPIYGRSVKGEPRSIIMSGCLGGFGLRLLSYVVALGARNILLLDRDPERKRSVKWVLENSFISYLLGDVTDLRIEIIYADVGKYDHVVDAVAAIDRLGLPPIGSVFHLAGVLDDKLIKDIDRDSFSNVFKPKANGAWNLHQATLNCDEVEHFIMFSSTSSAFGNPGQTNYSAANSFQDGLAAMRIQSGKPALSFCMGAVIEAGMASRNTQLLQMMKATGMPAISCIQAIEGLDAAVRSGQYCNSVVALANDLPANFTSSDFLRTTAQLVRNNAAFKIGGGATLSKDALVEALSTRVAALCGVENLDPSEPFSSYGLNSISVAELAAYLKNEMSYTVSAMELMTSATCESIAEGILQAQAGGNENVGDAEKTSEDEKVEENGSGAEATEQESESIWENFVEDPSLFEPAVQDYFMTDPGFIRHQEVQVVKPILKLDSGKADTDMSSIANPLKYLYSDIEKLPGPCQEVFENLSDFVKSIDVTNIEDATSAKEIRKVVVTGATGFVGRHFISDLLENTAAGIETIYCPVRASDDNNATERLISAMEEAGTWNDCFRPRLCIFKGDLLENCFGTSSDLYEEMIHSVDAVYHFASNLNLSASFDDLRKDNCDSMQSILRLCLTERRKHLFLVSTLGIFPQYFCQFSNEMLDMPIKRDVIPDIATMKRMFPLFMGGYPWSKFLNELICFKAADLKGLPLAVFRLPLMFANSRTGYCVPGEPTVRLFFAMMQFRAIPGRERPFTLEDSAVSNDLVLRISLNAERKNIIYNCHTSSEPFMTEASVLDMLGYPCSTTSYESFKAKCLKLGDEEPLNAYWLLLDQFAPYWVKWKRVTGFFPIDRSTVEEDCHPLPRNSNAIQTLTKCLQWMMMTEKKSNGFKIEMLNSKTEFDAIILPAHRLCSKYELDFDVAVPTYVREGLHRICDELHAPVHMLPEVALYLTSRLETRIHLLRLLTMHPEIENEIIHSPLFILGLNRTGTTFLHRMLEASGKFETPHIEDQVAIPKAEQISNPDPVVTARRLNFLRSMLQGYESSADGIHEIELGVADEDMVAHSVTFMSLEFDVLYDLPKYREWLESQQKDSIYEEHKKWMQFIVWSRRRRNPTCADRWCFKMPWHLRSLPQLLKTYPDARLVHTHREIEEVTGSWCSLVERQRERFVESIDRKQLGQDQLQSICETLSSGMKFREENHSLENRWLDIKFNDIVASPVHMANKVIEHAGIPVDGETSQRITKFVEESIAKHGSSKLHQYDFRDYGITSESMETAVFEEYRMKHGTM
jgi:thioester reductase-like protein